MSQIEHIGDLNIKPKPDLKAYLLKKNLDFDMNVSEIEDNGTDYVLRCIKGMYRGMFIYLNLLDTGEVIGSDDSCTL